jgi:hypothetical protein
MTAQSSFMKQLSESYLADLGRIVAAWSHIESQFDMLFLSLVVMRGKSSGSMSDPQVKLMGQDFKRRVAAFRNRIDGLERPEDTRKAVGKALSQLQTLRNERDQASHSIWNAHLNEEGGLTPDSATALFKSWKNSKPFEQSTIPQEKLKGTFQKMDALYWDLVKLSLNSDLRAQRPRQAPTSDSNAS